MATPTRTAFPRNRMPELPPGATLPPGPRLPTPLLTAMFMGFRATWLPRWQREYGDVFSLRIAPAGQVVVLADPEHIRAVFAGPTDVFHAGEGNAILGPVMGEHSVLLLDEAEHLAARKKVMQAFHGDTIAGYAQYVDQIATKQVARFPSDEVFAIHPHMNDISLEVIMRIVFGVTDEQSLDELRPLLRKVVDIGPTIFVGWMYPALDAFGPWKDYRRMLDRVDDILYREIRVRRSVSDLAGRTDMLSRLITADAGMSDAELRDHLVTMLLAGHETTASALAWAFHELVRTPRVLTRAVAAADAGDDAYLTAVVKEAMRLRPVIYAVARYLRKPVTVGGYDLPAGVLVFPAIGLVQRNPDAFPSPDEFRPERFLDGSPPPATWIPFGGGVRRCLGAGLATMEATTVLGTVLRSVDLRAADLRPEGVHTRNITLVPAKGTRVLASPRAL